MQDSLLHMYSIQIYPYCIIASTNKLVTILFVFCFFGFFFFTFTLLYFFTSAFLPQVFEECVFIRGLSPNKTTYPDDLFFMTSDSQDLTALAKELRELRSNEETNRPPVKVTDYSSSSEESESSEEDEGEGGAHDGTVPVSDIPRIM